MKKKVIICIIVIIILVISVTLGCIYFKKDNENPPVNTIEVVDSIEKYGYHLEDRDTEIYKEKYEELKNVLKSEEIDYEEYAKLEAQLFLIDLYTIDNKTTKYDVGALDFIYESEKEKFQNKVMDTIYKLVEDNIAGTRKQELPIVKEIEITNVVATTYKKGDESLNGYKVSANITYEKDLGYDKEVTLTLAKEENKLYVVNLASHK